MDTIAHPLHFSNGRMVMIDDASDAFAAQIIASAVKTALGELTQTPDFGSLPAEFSRLDTANIVYSLSKYHPTISIDSMRETYLEDELQVLIEFTRRDT